MSQRNGVRGPAAYPGGGQLKAYTTATEINSAVGGEIIDVLCTTNACIRINSASGGTAAVTTGADYYMVANVTYRFPCLPTDYISVVKMADDGIIYIHPVI